MARQTKKLTAVKVNALTAPGYVSDGDGLYLQVSPAGTKSWVFRYKLAGKSREMGLGSLRVVSLAEAREAAAACRKQLHAGLDPISARDRERAKAKDRVSVLFRECAQSYIEAHRSGWRNAKHADQWVNTLQTYAFPVLGDMPVDLIEPSHVERVLQPIWTAKAETAFRLRGRIECVLDWATSRKYRTGENPAKWRGNLDNLLPKVSRIKRISHFAALPFADIGAFVDKLRAVEGISARALEFTILTAARTGETVGAKWDEFDLDAGIWTIPAERMKAKREHRVALSGRALEILTQMKAAPIGDYVFPGNKVRKPLSAMAMLMTLRRMGHGDLTVHGFRSTFRDWASEATAYSRDVVEMALAHAVENRVEAAYRRGDLLDKRRDLMNDWARRCDTPAEPANVVPMRREASLSHAAA
jgi:integrase